MNFILVSEPTLPACFPGVLASLNLLNADLYKIRHEQSCKVSIYELRIFNVKLSIQRTCD